MVQLSSLSEILSESFLEVQKRNEGHLASYIPELAKVNPDFFGVSVTTVHGETLSFGHHQTPFSLQSTSKPFVYALALKQKGHNFVHSHVGVEPTGEAFNSIIELEEKTHRPFNPMINSGAIAITSLLHGETLQEKRDGLFQEFSLYLGGKKPIIDSKIYESEKSTAHRNRAIAYLMKHYGVMKGDIEEALNLYFMQCSISMNTDDLSLLAATLANHGVQPFTQNPVLSPLITQNTLSLMFTCGLYDTSGEWAFRVGLPAKSGVSGALFAVVPGQLGIAVYSPQIDSQGHSVRGKHLIEILSQKLELSLFK